MGLGEPIASLPPSPLADAARATAYARLRIARPNKAHLDTDLADILQLVLGSVL